MLRWESVSEYGQSQVNKEGSRAAYEGSDVEAEQTSERVFGYHSGIKGILFLSCDLPAKFTL